MAGLPLGWGDRNNQMSEHDMKLGGVAATKFGGTAKNAYENDTGNHTGYKNSDQVREFHLSEMQRQKAAGESKSSSSTSASSAVEAKGKGSSNVPDYWEERQKQKNLQTKQMGVFSNKAKDQGRGGHEYEYDDGEKNESLSAEVALVQTATFTLEKMAQSLEGRNNIKIPMAERAAFAKAVKEAMDALAKQS